MRVAVDFDAEATMRDGTILRANVYRPEAPGAWPTLLMRTPYGKDLIELISWPGLDPVQTARQGFIVVIQDSRGRFASGGEWEPFRFEREDGFDTVEWAATLRGSNGRVGMYGGSYSGNTQWMAAVERPPSLRAISPLMTWSDPTEGLFARGGAVELGLLVPWTLMTGIDYLTRRDSGDADIEAVIDDWDRLGQDGYGDLPIHDMGALRRHGMPELGSVRALTDPDVSEWSRITGAHDRVDVPSFHTGGWYDVFLQGTLDNYQAMVDLGRDARLVVGPWTHETFADPIGERLFGLRASRAAPIHEHGHIGDMQLAWFRRQLVPDADVALPEPPVRIFVMGRNEWRDESAWPPSRAESQRYFTHADGSLSIDSPSAEELPTGFQYDPGNPVPTLGGQTVMTPGRPAGPFDQARVEARPDVRVFTSECLREELEVTGRVHFLLYAQSSAPSTDFVARLCDVHPGGRSFNICDGILRIADSANAPRRYAIDLGSTSNVFLRGHRLRLHVTSSSFPRWDRNLNTGDQRRTTHQVAQQRVFHHASHATYLELPVVRR